MRRSARGTGFADRRRGLTLIELLFVMGLLAVLFGIGLGVFGSLRVGRSAARSTLETTLRAANNWAIARNAPANVRIDAKTSTMRAEGMSVIGTWRFEEMPVRGAFDFVGNQVGTCNIDEDGFRGSALSFVGTPSGTRVKVPVHKDPAFSLSNGFSISVVVRRGVESGGQVFDLGGVLDLQVTERGAVTSSFMTAVVDDFEGERDAGRARLGTEDGIVGVGTWSRIAVHYDGAAFSIVVDGLEQARMEQEGIVKAVESDLVFGGSGTPFPGAIDDFVISAIDGEQQFVLPEEALFAAKTPKLIRFQAGGGLDRRVHREPVQVGLVFEDGEEDWVRVNLYGTVE